MEDKLFEAFINKDYEYILQALEPLFKKYLRGVPVDLQDDLLQEYKILCFKIISEASFDTNN